MLGHTIMSISSMNNGLGIGAGYRSVGKLGIGATLFGIYRGQTYQVTNYTREVNYIDPYYNFGTVTNDEAIKYTSVRMLAKLGMAYIPGRLEIWSYTYNALLRDL